jgi:DNA-cytosine methyltransferase
MKIGSLFSGIGLLDLGLERAGLGKVAWQIEIDEWCRGALERRFPSAERYGDVRTAKPGPADLVCGGFPCQPVSVAGKRRAQADERWLWPEYARIIREARPAIVVIENVPGLRTAGLRDVLSDLASLGFDAEWTCFSAADAGAPHQRRRLWVVATDPDRVVVRDKPGWLGRSVGSAFAPVDRRLAETLLAADPDGLRRLEQSLRFAAERGWAEHCGWSVDPASLVDDGRSGGLARRDVGRKRKALGNGVVVRCAEIVGRAVLQAVGGGDATT